MWTRACATVATAMVVVVGCGGGDDDGGAKTTAEQSSLVTQPAPERPLTDQIALFNRVVAAQRCKQFVPLVASFLRARQPGSPAGPKECKGSDAALVDLRGRRFERAARFGTAGVVEERGPGKRRFTLWVLDADGRFRYTRVAGDSAGQVGSAPPARGAAELTAARFLKAVKDRDCAAMAPLFAKTSRLVIEQGPRKACQAVLKGRFLAPAVAKTPNLKAETFGGTQNLAVVGIPTRDAYFTLLLGAPGNPLLRVLDVIPSTPVDLTP